MTTRSRGRFITAYALLPIPLLLLAIFVWGITRVGQWLIVEDPLEPSRAIVVLGGHLPFRSMEAARIYQRGLAQEVWLTEGARPAEQAALKKLGILYIPEEIYNREVLERMGVPSQSIRLLGDAPRNTAEEILVIARELRKAGGTRAILVTSKPHSRRVKATWRALVGDMLQAEVRYPTDEPYDPSHWWKNADDALAVSREVFGLLNIWAGFPVRPDRE